MYIYIDDMIFIRNNPKIFDDFEKTMPKEFEMTNTRETSYFLKVEVSQSNKGIFISQKK